jgi:preprotein translocase SecE subunit
MKLLANTTDYFRGAIHELKQVRWPTRNQAVRLSVITIAFTFATAIAYGVVDFVLGRGVSYFLFFV